MDLKELSCDDFAEVRWMEMIQVVVQRRARVLVALIIRFSDPVR